MKKKIKNILEELETNPLFIELFNKSNGFSVKNNTIIFFNLKDYKENFLRMKLKNVKNVFVEKNTVKLILG